MKKLFTIICLALINSLPVISQSLNRENERIFIVSEMISSIDHAVGWNKNLSGQWNSFDRLDYNQNLNIILKENDKPDKYGFVSSHNSNFYSIEKYEVNYQGHEPMILIAIHFLDGYFKYPILMEDWQSIRSTSIYLISREEMNKLFKKYHKKLNQKSSFKVKTIRSDIFEDDKGLTLTEMIGKAKYSYPLKLTLQPVKEGDQKVIRFDLAKYYHFNQPLSLAPKFENNYFEINWEKFVEVFSDL